ncbi:MAG TPA: hypothetical protein VGF94_29055 [Kofleriaceae bacterium]|jgi:hypothetical protein
MAASSVTLALALASPAYAGQHAETDDEKSDDVVVRQVDRDMQAEYGIGVRVGTFHTGPVYNIGLGFAAEGGVRFDRLALLGEYQFLGLLDPSSTAPQMPMQAYDAAMMRPATPTGSAHRLGANARYSVARFLVAQNGIGVRGDVFVEGGLGEELIEWSGGGYLHRADVSLGAGLGVRFRGTHHHGGYQIGVRATFADPPAGYAKSGPPTCAGPCDGPTRPSSLDHSVLGTFTVVFGG